MDVAAQQSDKSCLIPNGMRVVSVLLRRLWLYEWPMNVKCLTRFHFSFLLQRGGLEHPDVMVGEGVSQCLLTQLLQ